MPYLLPPGDAFEDTLDAVIVFFPARDEYRRALWGQLSILTKYWLWEDDGAGGRNDAADSWDLAYAETIKGLEMFQNLLNNIQEISDAIRDKECCGQVPPSGQDTVGIDETQLPPSTVDVPSGEYPDDTGTQNEALSALCAMADHVATVMPGLVTRIETVMETASDIIAIATLFVLLAVNSIGVALASIIAGGALVTLFDILSIGDELLDLRDLIRGGEHTAAATATIAEIEGAHDEIRDAIACANTPDAAVIALRVVLDAEITSPLYRAVIKFAFGKGVMRLLFAQAANYGSLETCACSAPATACFGSEIDATTFASQAVAACHRLELYWANGVVSISAAVQGAAPANCGGVLRYRIWDDATACEVATTQVYNSNDPAVNVVGNYLVIVGNAAFTATVTW